VANGRKRKKTYRIRVGRLSLVMLVFAAAIGLLVWAVAALVTPEKVRWGRLADDVAFDAVVICQESIVTAEESVRVEYKAAEGQHVEPGGSVMMLYTSGYAQSDSDALYDMRSRI